MKRAWNSETEKSLHPPLWQNSPKNHSGTSLRKKNEFWGTGHISWIPMQKWAIEEVSMQLWSRRESSSFPLERTGHKGTMALLEGKWMNFEELITFPEFSCKSEQERKFPRNSKIEKCLHPSFSPKKVGTAVAPFHANERILMNWPNCLNPHAQESNRGSFHAIPGQRRVLILRFDINWPKTHWGTSLRRMDEFWRANPSSWIPMQRWEREEVSKQPRDREGSSTSLFTKTGLKHTVAPSSYVNGWISPNQPNCLNPHAKVSSRGSLH